MYIVDDLGAVVDAECSLDVFQGDPCLVIESSGGASPTRGVSRRNPEYNKLLRVSLERLARSDVQITRIVLDSRKVAEVPVEDRLVQVGPSYPIDLTHTDLEELRRRIQHEISHMHRSPAATKGGNGQKRIRICLSRAIAPDEMIADGSSVPATEDSDPYPPGLTGTERTYLRTARIGQGQFRSELIQAYGGTCPVTRISNPELLIASHIKPWKACNNAERLDPENGILLSVMVDRLFDRGFISFTDTGDLLVSPNLSDDDRAKCGLDARPRLRFSDRSRHFLEYHRRIVFRGS